MITTFCHTFCRGYFWTSLLSAGAWHTVTTDLDLPSTGQERQVNARLMHTAVHGGRRQAHVLWEAGLVGEAVHHPDGPSTGMRQR